ncbi:helix-turn-helix transcriptional regulator [Anoxybacillus ayderensis]|uniref:helix-turn-helix domain-containing protein n=1 Tax=Anoxybacillus ayderensis TaxID=265546 RepID=UPI002E1ACA7E|nr:helix-turn-helix transcriptional regulator [Anoxybacillus ayderensis]MED0687610.1 helix-turn-helix transcriptional regulator [Anoxybacillus ayderensis]
MERETRGEKEMVDKDGKITRNIGELMKRQRERKGYSIRTLAKRAGVTASHISRLEAGKREWSGISVSNLLSILRALDLDITILAPVGESRTLQNTILSSEVVIGNKKLSEDVKMALLDVIEAIFHVEWKSETKLFDLAEIGYKIEWLREKLKREA